MDLLAVLFIFLAGFGNPMQTAINSTLGVKTGSSLLGTTVAFVVGALVLMLLTWTTCPTIIPTAEQVASMSWWLWLAGVLGGVGVALVVIIFPHLGGIHIVLMPMIGQVVTSMLIDTCGWFGVEAIPFGMGRLAGLAMISSGLIIYMIGKQHANRQRPSADVAKWSLLALIPGVMFAIQPVMNGRVTDITGSSIMASFISYVVSSVVLVLWVLLSPSARKSIPHLFDQHLPWWVWTGGLIGAYYVIVFSQFTSTMGVGLVTLLSVLGMLVGGTLIDRFGLFGSAKMEIGPMQYVGMVLVLIGVISI